MSRMLLWVVVLLSVCCSSWAFETGVCSGEPRCVCKWSEGKRTADCAGRGLTDVPRGLSSDIQKLHLDNNPLRRLREDEFKSSNLLNLHIVTLQNCRIDELHEHAFRDLRVVTRIDLSHNNLTQLPVKSFEGNEVLKSINLAHNPLGALHSFQFPPLPALKELDLSHCNLTGVHVDALGNLRGSAIDRVHLHDNALRHLQAELLDQLTLTVLTLHNNPWLCDCRLKSLRDFVLDKRLYKRNVVCTEPSRLDGKTWDVLNDDEFACKPSLQVPYPIVFGSVGVDARLSCLVTGSPRPNVKWVINGRIANNNTYWKPRPARQRWLIQEQPVGKHGVSRWLNLTISHPDLGDVGEYKCVAENTGGMMERSVRLTFESPNTFSHVNNSNLAFFNDAQLTIVVAMALCTFIVLIVILFICCCCLFRTSRKAKKFAELHKKSNGSSNGHMPLLQQHQTSSLHNITIVSSKRGNGAIYDESNMVELRPLTSASLNSNPVINQAMSEHSSSSDTNGAGTRTVSSVSRAYTPIMEGNNVINNQLVPNNTNTLASIEGYPDLLLNNSSSHHSNTSTLRCFPHVMPTSLSPSLAASSGPPTTTLTADPSRLLQHQHLMLTPTQQMHYAHLYSPFQRSGTLPMTSTHHQNPRSVSFDQPSFVIQALPVVHHHHHLPNQSTPRPGYVTLPRRPRATSQSPITVNNENIYDGIGPRTSADGSSRLNLKTSSAEQSLSSSMQTTTTTTTAPVARCDTITEETIGSRDDDEGKSLHTTGSEMTLIEENLSGYCEPFGKALLPDDVVNQDEKHDTERKMGKSDAGNRLSVTSVESELEDLLGPTPKKETTTSTKDKEDDSQNECLLKDCNNTTTGATPTLADGGVVRGGSNTGLSLSKPKIKPVVPPKPKKSFQQEQQLQSCTTGPLINYQDEGADGSEV